MKSFLSVGSMADEKAEADPRGRCSSLAFGHNYRYLFRDHFFPTDTVPIISIILCMADVCISHVKMCYPIVRGHLLDDACA